MTPDIPKIYPDRHPTFNKSWTEGSDPNIHRRMLELKKQRDEIDEKIKRVSGGEIDLLQKPQKILVTFQGI